MDKKPLKTTCKSIDTGDSLNRRLCAAPMMEWSDRFCRYFWRILTKHTLLYTEMVTTSALLHGDQDRHLRFSAFEHPIAIQLGGSNPNELMQCAKLCEEWGYDEINLNVGCPSDRVQNNLMGACLMGHPNLVAECIAAMQSAVDIPVTIKHRIGIDEQDSYEELWHFVKTVAATGCSTFIVHARKAWLKGLSPKQNREIPELKYDTVYQLKQDFPDLEIIINGGIDSIEACNQHLEHVDGIMIGRAAYQNPYLLSNADAVFYDDCHAIPSRYEVLEQFLPFVEEEMKNGIYLNHISRHILGLFQGLPGARKLRRHISENAHKNGATIEIIKEATNLVQQTEKEMLEYKRNLTNL